MIESNEAEDHGPPRKTRRSSIFTKRLSVDVPDRQLPQPSSSQGRVSPAVPETEEQLSVKSYISKIEEEKRKWNELLQERKNSFRRLRDSAKLRSTSNEDTFSELLTEGDKKFLEDEGKYAELAESVKYLLAGTAMLKERHESLISLEKNIIDAAQSRINAVKTNVCKWADTS